MVLLMTICVTKVTTRQTFYKIFDPEQNITGTVLKEFKTKHKVQCLNRSVDIESVIFTYF